MRNEKIANAVVRRLPRYLRELKELESKGVERISSSELSERIGFTASQIRQDLNHFGCFGQQGYGYNVKDLSCEINRILGGDAPFRMAVAGCGRLGVALSNFMSGDYEGKIELYLFDKNPEIIGKEICGTIVKPEEELAETIRKNHIEFGTITVTKSAAQEVADIMKASGIKGIWNFTLMDLSNMDGVMVETVHLADSLRALTYYVSHMDE